MGYERYLRGRSQDDWNSDDTRFGRDEERGAFFGKDDANHDEDSQGRIVNRSFPGTY